MAPGWAAIAQTYRAVVVSRLREKAAIERAASLETEAAFGPVQDVLNQRAFAACIEDAAKSLDADDAAAWARWADVLQRRVVATMAVMCTVREAAAAVRVAQSTATDEEWLRQTAAYELYMKDAFEAAMKRLDRSGP